MEGEVTRARLVVQSFDEAMKELEEAEKEVGQIESEVSPQLYALHPPPSKEHMTCQLLQPHPKP